jgi:hypothetical protein
MANKTEKSTGKNGGARKGAGRKCFEPTDREREQVEAMAGFGVPFEQIAALVRDGIHKETLFKYFRKELDQGKAKANAQIGRTLFQQAVNGNTAAAIWWSKSQMGWRETQQIDHTTNGESLQPQVIEIVAGHIPKGDKK